MMNECLGMIMALVTGVLVGGIFFGGLWYTVHQAISSKRLVLWFLGSLLLRTSIVLAGFYIVSGSQWERFMAGLVGFIVARVMVTRLTRAADQPTYLAQEADNAH